MNWKLASIKFKGVYLKQHKNGDVSYAVNYKDKMGVLKWVVVGKKSEGINIAYCFQQRNDIINKAKFGEDAPIIKYKTTSDYTFAKAAKDYLEGKDLKQRTIWNYQTVFDYLYPLIGEMALTDISQDDIQKIKNSLKGINKAPKTINYHIEVIRMVFNHAIQRGKFKGDNPAAKIQLLKVDNDRERYLSVEEIGQLRDAVKKDLELLLFVELCLSTGGRLETILSITKKDVNLKQGTISLKNHKSDNSYTGYISNALQPLLTKRLDNIKNPNEKLIPTPSRTIQRNLKKILDSLFNKGLDTADAKNRAVIHTLRHTFASHLCINGTPIFTVMKLLDHKSIDDTLRYAKLSPDNGNEAVKALW